MSNHPLPNGTPVIINDEVHMGTGVICDHETRRISKTETAIFYHVAMDWPRTVKGFLYDQVEPTHRTR